MIGSALIGFAVWVLLAAVLVAAKNRAQSRAQVKRWRAAYLQAQGRPTIILPCQDPPYPFPTDPDTWNMLLSSEERVKWFFSPESQRRGLTAQFLAAYAKQYVAEHYPTDPGVHPAATTVQARFARTYLDGLGDTCRHRNAVPVEDLLGEVVAWLCPDCDDQLPVTVPIPEDVAAAWRMPSMLPPFTPDPRLTRRFKQ